MRISKQSDQQLMKLYGKHLSESELEQIRKNGGGIGVIFSKDEIKDLRNTGEPKKKFNKRKKVYFRWVSIVQ